MLYYFYLSQSNFIYIIIYGKWLVIDLKTNPKKWSYKFKIFTKEYTEEIFLVLN